MIDVNQPIRIALLTPSSASNAGAAALGKSMVNTARMAITDLGDPNLQLEIYDTAGDEQTARTVAQRAINEGAKLIIGPLFGANTAAIASTAAQAKVKVISFSTDSTVAGGQVYLSGFLPEKAAGRITSFARSKGYERFGVFYPTIPYGEVALRGAQSTMGPAIASVTGYERSEEGIPPAAQQFADQVRTTDTTAVLVAESGGALSFVTDQLAAQGLTDQRVKYLGLGEWNAPQTLDARQLRGAWFPAPDPAAVKRFADRYRQEHGAAPPALSVLAYDAMQIAGQLLATARADGSTDPFSHEALRRAKGFRGALGPIRFDQNGLAERSMAILQVESRSFNVIDGAPPLLGGGS